MAKYVIDIPDEYEKRYAQTNCETLYIPMQVGTRNYNVWVGTGLRVTPYTEPDRKAIDLQYAHDIENVAKMNYNEGAKDAWDFARAINYMGYDDFVSCFGGKIEEAVYELSYSEVKAKYEAWKRTKEEIHVGDEVYDHTISGKGIVTNVENKNMVGIMWDDGSVNESVSVEDLRKTGRHFDEIVELLKKMREGKQ